MARKDNGSPKTANTLLNNRLMAYSVIAGAVLGNTAARATVQKTTPNVILDADGETFNVVFGGETKFHINLKKSISTYVYSTTMTTITTITNSNPHQHVHPHTFSFPYVPTTTTTWTQTFQLNSHILKNPVSTRTYTTNNVGVYPKTTNAGFVNSSIYAKALNAGVTVGSTAGFRDSGAFNNMANFYASNYFSNPSGPFINTTGKFLGLRFQISGSTCYGWVQVDVNGDASQVIIQTQAYEDSEGLAIVTGSDTSLPVQSTGVTAECTSSGIVLQWATESETDHLGFVIERRLAGSEDDYQVISSYETNSELLGQDNSSTHKAYAFTDSDVEAGVEYEYKVSAVDTDGSVSSEQIIKVSYETDALPTELALLQNYPNPFNPSTHIGFDLPEDTHVKLSVYNVSGQVVKVLMDQHMNAGRYIKDFDASNFSAGIYFYELIAGDKRMVRKMHLIK